MKKLLNTLLWPLLKVSWEKLSKKNSHWWHWEKCPLVLWAAMAYRPEPDKSAKPRIGWWSTFWQTNFGWKKVAIFRVSEDWKPPQRSTRYFRIGFACEAEGKEEICQIPLKKGTRFGMLVGPDPMIVFAASEHNRQLPIKFVKYCYKKDLPKDVFLG